jgi:hypothetical protein
VDTKRINNNNNNNNVLIPSKSDKKFLIVKKIYFKIFSLIFIFNFLVCGKYPTITTQVK